MSQVLYAPKDTKIHGLDFRVKLFWAISVVLLCYVIFDTIVGLLLVFLWVIIVVAYARLIREILLRFVKFYAAIAVITVIIQGLFRGGAMALVTIPNFVPLVGGMSLFTLEGVQQGMLITLRLINIATALMVTFLTTSPTKLSQGLMKLGFPFKYATLVNMLIRFYPLMADRFSEIQSAQASRAFEVEKGGFFQKFRNFVPLLIPTLLNALRNSTGIAIAAELRGLSIKSKRTFLKESKLGKADALFLTTVVIIFVGSALLKLLGYNL